jgi:hypothetical protein
MSRYGDITPPPANCKRNVAWNFGGECMERTNVSNLPGFEAQIRKSIRRNLTVVSMFCYSAAGFLATMTAEGRNRRSRSL